MPTSLIFDSGKKMKIELINDQRQYLINGKVYSRVSDVAGAGEKPYLEQWRKRVGRLRLRG